MKLNVLVFAIAAALVLPSDAFAYCSEPSSEPYCLDDDDTFRDESRFESCRWDVEQFVDDVEFFNGCQNDEQQSKLNEIDDLKKQIEALSQDIDMIEAAKAEQIARAKNAIERFNCGAESGESCY